MTNGIRKIIAVLVTTFAFAASANAMVLKTWDLTNKSPGALGPDYGLRLNQLNNDGSIGGSRTMIFNFEAMGQGVKLDLLDTGGGTRALHLSGTAHGALFAGGAYSAELAGTYALDFTWSAVTENVLGFEYLGDYLLGTNSIGAGSGTVQGTTPGTAYMGTALDILPWSGSYTYTLDVKESNTPDASGWLTYGAVGTAAPRHNGDFGFNMHEVPEPGSLALLGLGLLGLVKVRRKA